MNQFNGLLKIFDWITKGIEALVKVFSKRRIGKQVDAAFKSGDDSDLNDQSY